MSRLMRTSEIEKHPVVTMAGEDVAQVKDIVFAAAGGAVGGFTLAGRGLFAGPKKEALSWSSVRGLGNGAVMIDSESVLESRQSVIDKSAASGGSGGDVLGSTVLSDAGTELGTVVDVIVQIDEDDDGRLGGCDVVGYEIEASEALDTRGTKLLIPLPDTLAASGEFLMVPASAKDFVGRDLAGFGASVEAFRNQLKGA